MNGSDPRAIARFIEAWARERGETLEQFGERSGLNASGLYQMLRGERQYVQAPTLAKIAQAMNMSTAELLTAVGSGAPGADPDEATLLSYYRDVAPDRRMTVLDLVAALRDRAHPPTPARRRRDARARRYEAEHRKLTRPDEDESPEPPESRYAEYYPPVDDEIAGIMAALAPLSRRAAVA